jgi:putative toxin-antitoxin system antitoxin component (TIGR02293 family)
MALNLAPFAKIGYTRDMTLAMVPQQSIDLTAIVRKLGSPELRKVSTDLELDEEVRRGFPVGVIGALSRLGLTIDELAKLTATSPRTINRLLKAKKPMRLDLSVSERALRVAAVLALGEQLLGSLERVLDWMRTPNRYLGADAPMRALQTEYGRDHVVQSMYAVAYGGIG